MGFQIPDTASGIIVRCRPHIGRTESIIYRCHGKALFKEHVRIAFKLMVIAAKAMNINDTGQVFWLTFGVNKVDKNVKGTSKLEIHIAKISLGQWNRGYIQIFYIRLRITGPFILCLRDFIFSIFKDITFPENRLCTKLISGLCNFHLCA